MWNVLCTRVKETNKKLTSVLQFIIYKRERAVYRMGYRDDIRVIKSYYNKAKLWFRILMRSVLFSPPFFTP